MEDPVEDVHRSGNAVIQILCLEDDAASAKQLQEIAESAAEPVEIAFDHFESIALAKRAVSEKTYDVALVDIQVPMRGGEVPRADGGALFLDYVLTSPHAKRPRYIVGITAEKDLFEKIKPQFAQQLFALVERASGDDGWRAALTSFFMYIAGLVPGAGAAIPRTECESADLLIVTAIRETELQAIKRHIGVEFTRFERSGDPIEYWRGKLVASSREQRIVAFATPEQGMPVASAVVSRAVELFRPRAVAMSGIAASADEKINVGDILFAEQTWDYTTGKRVSEDGKEAALIPENRSIRVDPIVVDQLRRLASDTALLDAIRADWPAEKPETALRAKGGPFGSGGGVVEATPLKKEILGRDRKTVAIDMEAHGVAVSCWYAAQPRPRIVIAKAVVDHGIPPKTDKWHLYASYTSARFIAEWARRFL